MKKVLLIASLIILPTMLSACGNCGKFGSCSLPSYTSVGNQQITVVRGMAMQVDIPLNFSGVPRTTEFEFFAENTAVQVQNDPYLLDSLDDGNLLVHKGSLTFFPTAESTATNVKVFAKATAALTGDNLVQMNFGVRKVGDARNSGDITISVRVVESR